MCFNFLLLYTVMIPTIEALAKNPAAEAFDNPEFWSVIEDHLTWLINHPRTKPVQVTAHQVEVYDFDWIGLLTNLQIPIDIHRVVIRMNGGMSLTDVPSELRVLLVPDTSIVQNLLMLHSSTKRIS